MNKIKNAKVKQGFTIIEVVLVLAIAGLIFLMVFVALPDLQRNQRDTQRRQDYADLSANITSYMASNNGNLPKVGASLAPNKYINSTGEDPNGITYDLTVVQATNSAGSYGSSKVIKTSGGSASDLSHIGNLGLNATSVVYVVTHADCSGVATDGAFSGAAVPQYNVSNKAFAIYGALETGSYCQASTSGQS